MRLFSRFIAKSANCAGGAGMKEKIPAARTRDASVKSFVFIIGF
jgi:hypothetical protein